MKTPLKLSLISLTLVVGAFLFPNFVSAQTLPLGYAFLLSQTDDNSGTTYIELDSNYTADINIGNYITGSTTQINVKAQVLAGGGSPSQNLEVKLLGYSDSSYITNVQSASYLLPISNGAHATQIYELPYVSGDGRMIASRYYRLQFIHNTNPTVAPGTRWFGVYQSIDPFQDFDFGITPWVQVIGQVQSIDPSLFPNSNASGISTSSIQANCSQNYATSTGFFSDIANGVSYGFCVAFSYLLVPSPGSLQAFNSLSSTTKSKIPFSYFYQLESLYAAQTSTTSEFISIAFDISSTSVKNTSIGIIIPSVNAFSTTTIGQYISPSFLSILRTLMSSVIWLLFAYYAYGVVTRMLSRQQ